MSSTTTAKPAPTTIRLDVSELPDAGLAMYESVNDTESVILLDLNGDELLRLDGWQLVAPGPDPIWLTRDQSTYYRLDPARRMLIEGTPRFEEPATDIPPPDASGGFWREVIPSPDGGRVLAQWSGECEVPTAYLVESNRIVHSLGDETIALGWLDNGTAVISTLGPGCGDGDAPGTYKVAVDHPDDRIRITTYEYGAMWQMG